MDRSCTLVPIQHRQYVPFSKFLLFAFARFLGDATNGAVAGTPDTPHVQNFHYCSFLIVAECFTPRGGVKHSGLDKFKMRPLFLASSILPL